MGMDSESSKDLGGIAEFGSGGDWPAVLGAVLEKAMGPGLDHLGCEGRVRQAMVDVYLVATDPVIRGRWEAEVSDV